MSDRLPEELWKLIARPLWCLSQDRILGMVDKYLERLFPPWRRWANEPRKAGDPPRAYAKPSWVQWLLEYRSQEIARNFTKHEPSLPARFLGLFSIARQKPRYYIRGWEAMFGIMDLETWVTYARNFANPDLLRVVWKHIDEEEEEEEENEFDFEFEQELHLSQAIAENKTTCISFYLVERQVEMHDFTVGHLLEHGISLLKELPAAVIVRHAEAFRERLLFDTGFLTQDNFRLFDWLLARGLPVTRGFIKKIITHRQHLLNVLIHLVACRILPPRLSPCLFLDADRIYRLDVLMGMRGETGDRAMTIAWARTNVEWFDGLRSNIFESAHDHDILYPRDSCD